MINIKYAGIGSRKTPIHICKLMEDIAANLAQYGWMLRSGHAQGADIAFEVGCNAGNGKKEIFTKRSLITDAAFSLAKQFHPAWDECDEAARKLHARNGYIILGETLDDPVDVVICYGPGGFEWGGTSQGLRIAKHYNIPILNLYNEEVYNNLKECYGSNVVC